MGKLNLEYFLARRIASYSKGARKNVMIRIATLSVTISVAVMIVSLAVILGFRKEITAKLTGFDAHIQIVHLNAYTSNETIPIDRDLPFLSQLRRIPGCVRVVPYAQKIGIPRGERALQGIMLKGVDSTYDWSFFQKNLVEGSVPDVRGERNKDILISRSLADLLEVSVGDPLEMLFIQESRSRDRFRVSGIYDTHFGELDQTVALTDLRNVQRLNGWDSTQITGYEVTVSDFSKLDQFTDSVYQVIMDNVPAEDQSPVRVVNLRERFPMIFDWLNAHNVNVGVIITIMLLVALFNMVAALLIILLERTSMIGILKTLGMDNRALQKMFVIRSSFVVLKGLLWGNIVGIGLCLLQHYTGWVTLNEEGYFLTTVPISMDWRWLLLLDGATFLVIVALMALPTMIISLILPEKTIRFE